MKVAILFCIASSALASSQCGVPIPKPTSYGLGRYPRAIVGGNLVPKAKWPWQIFLRKPLEDDGKLSICGGTVISDRWILTAAHCMNRTGLYTVYGGISNYTSIFQSNVIRSNVLKIRKHRYNKAIFENDIALLQLETPLTFNHLLSPICLPNRDQYIPDDGYAVITGYGMSDVKGYKGVFIGDGQLRESILPIVNNNICKAQYARLTPREVHAWDNIVCAGSFEHTTGSGDSGGPLLMKAKDGRWFQIGITNFAASDEYQSAGSPNGVWPAGFADVRKYCDWIAATTRGEAKCQDDTVTMEGVRIHV